MASHFDPNYYLEQYQVDELSNHIINIYKEKVNRYNTIESFKGNGKGRLRTSCNKTLQAYYLTKILFLSGRRVTEIVGNRKEKRLPGLCIEHINFDNKTVTYYLCKKNQTKQYKKEKKIKKDGSIIINMYKIPHDELLALKKAKKEYKKVLPLTNKLSDTLKEYIKRLDVDDKLFNISRATFDKILKEAYKRCSFNVAGNKKVRFVETAEPVFKVIKGKKRIINHNYKFYYRILNKRVAAHIFRHSFAYNFLEKNKTDQTALEKLRRILEHHSFDITKDYVHFKNEDLRSSMDNL